MSLNPGARVGPYEIVGPLGTGGMGEVYRARDVRLDRFVAIKILPETLGADPEFRERFDREARTIARLNDPHICAIHDLGYDAGVSYLVMEYLEGTTLATRLERGPLPLAEAITRAIEIAHALDRAHRAGVVHRDLKPANVMLTKSGVKLLDFGVARTVATPVGGRVAGVAGQGAGDGSDPTVAAPLTAEGRILGTLHYMAPEQLEGKGVDVRSDVWSFGCVLHEMLTGGRAFTSDSQAGLIGAILRDEPRALSTVERDVPAAVDRITAVCLAKEPDDRWQSAGDIATTLRLVRDGLLTGNIPARSPSVVPWRPWALVAVLTLATIVLSTLLVSRTTPPPAVMRTSILPPNGSEFVSTWIDAGPVEISPDGKRLVFVARTGEGPNQLWVRMLSESSARALAGTDGARRPFWSPDGRFIGFFTERALMKVDVNGGPAFSLAPVNDSRGGTWNRDNVILFSPDSRGPVFRVSADGGPATPVSHYRPDHATHRYPRSLPDGQHFLYLVRKSGAGAGPEPAIMVGSLDGAEPTLVVNVASNAVYASDHLLYVREGALVAQRFDLRTLALSGEPTVIAADLRMDERFSRGVFSASETGILVYQAGKTATLSTLQWFDREGRPGATVGEPAQFFNGGEPQISPDGTRATAAIVDLRTGSADIWVIDLVNGTRNRFTSGPDDKQTAIWTHDGRRIAYAHGVTQPAFGGYDIVSTPVAGGGSPETLLSATAQFSVPRAFSPDGRFLMYQSRDQAGRDDLWALLLDGERGATDQKPQRLAATPALEMFGQFSPDGRYVAFSSDESGRFEIYVVPFPPSGRQWQVSAQGGTEPRWRKDGKELFFFAPDNRLMAAAVTTGEGGFAVGVIQPLFQTRSLGVGYRYDVAPDGRRFLVTTSLPEALSPITMITNWMEQVRPR